MMKVKSGHYHTRSSPHPVGMKARMQTKMSRTVMPGIAIKITTMEINVMNMRSLINRNTSWNSALNLLLPTDTVCKRKKDEHCQQEASLEKCENL
jgi:hypothetical protein